MMRPTVIAAASADSILISLWNEFDETGRTARKRLFRAVVITATYVLSKSIVPFYGSPLSASCPSDKQSAMRRIVVIYCLLYVFPIRRAFIQRFVFFSRYLPLNLILSSQRECTVFFMLFGQQKGPVIFSIGILIMAIYLSRKTTLKYEGLCKQHVYVEKFCFRQSDLCRLRMNHARRQKSRISI